MPGASDRLKRFLIVACSVTVIGTCVHLASRPSVENMIGMAIFVGLTTFALTVLFAKNGRDKANRGT